jgi:hypothetical protein
MNSKLFKALMVIHGDTNATLAEYLGLTEQSVCNKINENGTEFKQGEIGKMKTKWNLNADQIDAIFFNGQVSNLDTEM